MNHEADLEADELDKSEFDSFFDHYYPIILNYTMRRLMNMANAEDATAETFSRAFANFDNLGPEPRALQAWLFRTATNIVHDVHRRQRRRKEIHLDMAGDQEGDSAAWLADPGPSVTAQLEELETYARVHTLIGRLRPKYQDVLVLRFMEAKSLQEIAEILEIRVGTVKWRLHTALKKFGSLARKDDGLLAAATGSGGRDS